MVVKVLHKIQEHKAQNKMGQNCQAWVPKVMSFDLFRALRKCLNWDMLRNHRQKSIENTWHLAGRGKWTVRVTATLPSWAGRLEEEKSDRKININMPSLSASFLSFLFSFHFFILPLLSLSSSFFTPFSSFLFPHFKLFNYYFCLPHFPGLPYLFLSHMDSQPPPPRLLPFIPPTLWFRAPQ